jgi:hypothetical protein
MSEEITEAEFDRRVNEAYEVRGLPRMDSQKSAHYCVGQANDPQPEDKLRYYDFSEAVVKARSMADCDFNRPIAVWDERDEIVRLYICGQQFRSV